MKHNPKVKKHQVLIGCLALMLFVIVLFLYLSL